MASKKRKTKKLNTTKRARWMPGEGEVIEGVYTGKLSLRTKYGERTKYLLNIRPDATEPELVELWQCAQLARAFDQIKEGDWVRLTYLGKVEEEGAPQPVNAFEVEVEDA